MLRCRPSSVGRLTAGPTVARRPSQAGLPHKQARLIRHSAHNERGGTPAARRGSAAQGPRHPLLVPTYSLPPAAAGRAAAGRSIRRLTNHEPDGSRDKQTKPGSRSRRKQEPSNLLALAMGPRPQRRGSRFPLELSFVLPRAVLARVRPGSSGGFRPSRSLEDAGDAKRKA